MATDTASNGSALKPQPSNHPILPSHSAPDSNRRHSLPLHFLPPSLWSANTSSVSLVETGEAARGEHILDEVTVANRISALRQLNGATRSRHRYAKSTGARNSTFSQPVIVRTYSGASRPRSQQRDLVVKKENGYTIMTPDKKPVKLPPVEAFTFKGIMDEIRHGVSEDLERIAEICARSKYSLSNQYEVHMPPHGRGEAILVGPGGNVGGPTLQAIASDEEQVRHTVRGSRTGRRTKSAAYGTLETIMSSSRSSDEDKSRKKPAAVLAEEVRGRAAKKELESVQSKQDAVEVAVDAEPATPQPTRHVRSKSATFASMIIDNVHGFRNEASPGLISPISLISEPARPQTSTAGLDNISNIEEGGAPFLPPTFQSLMSSKPALIRNESIVSSSTLKPDEPRSTILESIGAWLPWSRPAGSGTLHQRVRSGSHAEGSLRELLKGSESDRKGKGVDRAG